MSVGADDVDPRALREAAVWLMRLHAGEIGSREQRARLAAWRNHSAEHERAWQRAERLLGTVGEIPAGIGRRALDRLGHAHTAGRRDALKTLALLLAVPGAGWMAFRASPWREALADAHTLAGEQREIILADGSRVRLNTDSAIDIHFDAGLRRLALRRGEILVATAPDRAAAARPFVVTTTHGQLHALGTRFIVRQCAASSRVGVLEGAVDIRTAASRRTLRVAAQQQADFSAADTGPLQTLSAAAEGWTRGVLYADNQRLADFLAELGRYRPGLLRCDPAVADRRISGLFQLADTDRVLALLASNHALRIEARTRWWVTVTAA